VKDTPGPGQYSTDKRTGHQGSKMGASKRADFTGGKDVTPGPGTHNTTDYDVQSRKGKGSTFGPHSTGNLGDRSI
jgi:hypothetical protein